MIHNRHGFSLLELVISLAILAALTSVAIRSTNNLASQTRYQTTTRSLDEIRNAIVGPANQRGPDGSAQVTGFVADTGRLPNYQISTLDPLYVAADPLHPPDPLNELHSRNSVALYTLATSGSDPAIQLGAGWQGPYVHLGAGPSYIRDGWGNSFHCYDASGAGTTGAIYQIASWGSDNAAGGTNIYDADVSIPNPTLGSGGFLYSTTFLGRVTMNVGVDPSTTCSGPALNATYSTPTGVTPALVNVNVALWVCYFGPKDDGTVGETPLLLGDSGAVAGPHSGSAAWLIDAANGFPFALSGTIGPRVIRAYLLPTGSAFNSTTVLHAYAVSVPLNVTGTGGSQTIPNLVLPHYNP